MKMPGSPLFIWLIRGITILLLGSVAIVVLATALGVPGLSLLQVFNCSNEAPTAVVASTPTVPASPPTSSDKVATCANYINTNVFTPLQNLAIFIAEILVFLLMFLILMRLFQLSRISSLVIDPFKNASGNTDLNPLLDGLNEQMREMMMVEIEDAKDGNLSSLQPGHLHTHLPIIQSPAILTVDYCPPPVADIDQSFNDLSTAIKNLGSGSAQTILQFFSALFSQSGTKVATTLQTDGGSPAKFGISLEISDLRHQAKPILHTIWEAALPASTAANTSINEQANRDIDNQDAFASYRLGLVYEGQQRFNEAKTQYIQALTKQPDYAPASEGLKRMLVAIKTDDQRILYLLQLAACWLAIELAYQSLTQPAPFWARLSNQFQRRRPAHASPKAWTRSSIVQQTLAKPLSKSREVQRYQQIYAQIETKSYNAVLNNFIGELHQSVCFNFPAYSFFYNQAIEAFKRAIQQDPDWFLPPMCLADTYLLQVTGVRSYPGILDPQTVYQAIAQYDKAISSYNTYMDTHRQISFTSDATQQRCMRIIRRLALGQASAYLLTKDPPLVQEAINIIKALTGDPIFIELAPVTTSMLTGQQELVAMDDTLSVITYMFPQMPRSVANNLHAWSLEEEADSSLLYTLAAWFGLVRNLLGQPSEDQEEYVCQLYIEEQVRLYLVYSLSLNDSLWEMAANEWNFTQTFTQEQFAALREEMLKETCKDPDWSSQDDEYLRQSAQGMLRRA
jgi:tetratricopeptide (TPR) repeat protein